MAERNYGVDLVKTIAIVCVIIIHTCSPGYTVFASFDWNAALFWGALARPAVPLFLMCSGTLLLSPQKELGLKKLFFHSMLRLVLALFFWAAFYAVYHLYMEGTFTTAALVRSIKDIILFRHEFHLYYLHIILLVYLFLPVTRLLIRNANREQLNYIIVVWCALGILYPTVRTFWPFRLLGGIPAQWAMNMTYAAIGYGILGYYLQKYPLSRQTSFILWAAGFALTWGGSWWNSMEQGQFYQQFLQGMSPGVAMMAAGAYGVSLSHAPHTERIRAVCRYISRGSFCVYLVHVLFYYMVRNQVAQLPCLLSIPLFSFLILALSLAVYTVLSRIPVVRQWLI